MLSVATTIGATTFRGQDAFEGNSLAKFVSVTPAAVISARRIGRVECWSNWPHACAIASTQDDASRSIATPHAAAARPALLR